MNVVFFKRLQYGNFWIKIRFEIKRGASKIILMSVVLMSCLTVGRVLSQKFDGKHNMITKELKFNSNTLNNILTLKSSLQLFSFLYTELKIYLNKFDYYLCD